MLLVIMIASISQAFPRWAAGVLCFSMVLNPILKIACGSILQEGRLVNKFTNSAHS